MPQLVQLLVFSESALWVLQRSSETDAYSRGML